MKFQLVVTATLGDSSGTSLRGPWDVVDRGDVDCSVPPFFPFCFVHVKEVELVLLEKVVDDVWCMFFRLVLFVNTWKNMLTTKCRPK